MVMKIMLTVDTMLTDIEETYQRICHMDATCESILRYSISATGGTADVLLADVHMCSAFLRKQIGQQI